MAFIDLYSFRARIALVLILTLVAATGVLFLLNQWAEKTIVDKVEDQRAEFAKAINVAQRSLTSKEYVREFLKEEKIQDDNASYIKRVLVAGDDGTILDSSNQDDIDKPFNSLGFGSFEQAIDLLNVMSQKNLPYKVYTFPIETQARSNTTNPPAKQYTYIIIIFSDDLTEQLKHTSFGRLLGTGGVLVVSLIASLFLIFGFIKPLAELVKAARRVAEGDFEINLPVRRQDELGQLIKVFNEMVKGLRERRELELRLHRAEQSAIVGRLASGIAHEIKNPLNYISLTIDYLRSKFAPTEESAREKFVDKMDGIKDEIKRLDHLTRNFLSYGRPLHLNPKPINLRELIEGILTLTTEQAEQQSIKMALDKTTDLPVIEADLERLKSCFSNLILNAQQAMPNGGELSINFQPYNKGVEVFVTDTGTGIEPENLEKIFEPYFSTKETGTGLGLALVKRIVEGHGGRLQVESVVNKGTTFRVWLPLQPTEVLEGANAYGNDKLESSPAI
ncbi:MAG: HAMP domain-containing protein [Acidobacteria bacterium]|nr:HAMP domain-containing protein [Acidobacteriota bacterium]